MELSDLTIFREVVSQGSITKAANELGYVQSNITSRIQQLENEMSIKLLYRHPRGVTPTVAGKILFEYSEKIITLVAEAKQSIKNPQLPEGKLTLGIAQTISLAYHSSIVKYILEAYPSINVSVMVKHSDDLIAAVENNILDFALVTGPIHHSDLMELRVAKEELVLVSHEKEKIKGISELANHTVLLHESPCAFRKVLETFLTDAAITPPKILEYGTPESLLNGITEGVGISLLPLSAVKKHVESGLLHAVPIEQPTKTIATVLIFQRRILPSQYFDILAETLKKITGIGSEFI
ncbi:LysR family transcriptional regulator [Pelosinus propionicus]|uniref:DNA-binding transcriptional regulator, LysR family n=1 Tax=Pelosinus propionicus DSM 13327 TaxID=1123291 RepID=A0A1I4LRQ0_9FIRM|nr:LysR family transcriptional regulator [Pelosinus propionicus]SFL93493.1 DNA-binding transcriptional regulator, LysR family [Pelosinus propionicus DSM 13327]